jgi:multidrug resistance efflux pump
METVEVRVGELEAELEQWGTRLDKLLAKAEVAGAAAKIDYRQRLEHLKEKYDAADAKLSEVKAAGSSKWAVFQGGVETAWSELANAFTRLAN